MTNSELKNEHSPANASDELNLPEQLDPEYFRDFDLATANKFCYLAQHHYATFDAAFGDNEPLLQGLINSSSDLPTIVFDGAHSCLWCDHNHVTRQFGLKHKISENDGKVLLEVVIRASLLPWERWRGELEYAEPVVRDGFAQAIGLRFPVLNLTPALHEFRLLMLLPSNGSNESPLEGILVVSNLYLHSCFRALRHSRGNPGFGGSMIIDGASVEISKNLEVFLRHARHPLHAQMFYIRELCINRQDEEENEVLLTGQFHALVEDCSCGVIDMNRAMHELDSKGLVPEPVRMSEKRWDEVSDEETDSPWHRPLLLRYYKHDPLHNKTSITEDDISQLNDYEYVPIDLAAREIRLLGIYPTHQSEEPIVVDVAYIPLRMNVSYHALSYVWGAPEITRYLKNWNARIGVPDNLYSALHAIREQIVDKDGGPCYVWVDAICINQSDEIEKDWTIRRMHNIFEGAASVQICIASPKFLTMPVIKLLQDCAAGKFDDVSEQALFELDSLEAWTDLFVLFKQPYFGRRWIVQELASASAPHVMMAGSHSRGLRTVSIAAYFLESRFPELLELWLAEKHPILQQCEELSQYLDFEDVDGRSALFTILSRIRNSFTRVQRIDHIRHMWLRDQPSSFLFLAILTQSAQCADPRDILYSLWNICRERSASGLPSNYKGSIEECYTAFTKFYASHTSSLDIMCISQSDLLHSGIQSSNRSDWNSELSMPSWCPDYRRGGDISSLIRYEFISYGISSWPNMDFAPFHADRIEPGDQPSACFRFEDRVLVAQGIVLDTIAWVSETPFTVLPWKVAGHNFEDFSLGNFNHFLSEVSKGAPKSTNKKHFKDQTFSDMINMLTGEHNAIEAALIEVDEETVAARWSYVDNSPYQMMAHIYERAATFTKGRRLIVTENGYMGLAPAHAKEGYKLAILLGCSVPVLLEQVEVIRSKEPDHSENMTLQAVWNLKGDCFVQHWMQGQMMKSYGETTEKAWRALSGSAFEVHIR